MKCAKGLLNKPKEREFNFLMFSKINKLCLSEESKDFLRKFSYYGIYSFTSEESNGMTFSFSSFLSGEIIPRAACMKRQKE